eukprot:m.443611 g.443611  ORF g.443611 m.443611 type:complete len:352 (+) comp18984_c0_seq1:686-1741(+)
MSARSGHGGRQMHSHTTLQYNHYGTTVGTSETKRLRSTQIHTNKEYNKRSPLTAHPDTSGGKFEPRPERVEGGVRAVDVHAILQPKLLQCLAEIRLVIHIEWTSLLCVRHEEVLHPRGLELRVVACQPWCFDHPSGNHLTVVVRVLIDHKGEIELLGNRLHQVRKGCAWGALKRPGRPRAHNARVIAPKRFDVAKYPFVLRILKVVLHLAIASREDLESLMGTGGRDDRVSGCHGRDNVLHDTLSQTVVHPPNTILFGSLERLLADPLDMLGIVAIDTRVTERLFFLPRHLLGVHNTVLWKSWAVRQSARRKRDLWRVQPEQAFNTRRCSRFDHTGCSLKAFCTTVNHWLD